MVTVRDAFRAVGNGFIRVGNYIGNMTLGRLAVNTVIVATSIGIGYGVRGCVDGGRYDGNTVSGYKVNLNNDNFPDYVFKDEKGRLTNVLLGKNADSTKLKSLDKDIEDGIEEIKAIGEKTRERARNVR
jgi:hypothetical protein